MKFTDPTGNEQKRTIVRRLIPTVDKIRDLATRFGMRPYTVRIIRVKWSGGQIGDGQAYPVSEIHLLPVPRLTDLDAVQEILTPVGIDEIGNVLISRISASYTEEQLRGFDQNGNPPGPDDEIFYEVTFVRTDGLPGERRRFHVRFAPVFIPGKVQWQVRLERAHPDRLRDGTVDQ